MKRYVLPVIVVWILVSPACAERVLGEVGAEQLSSFEAPEQVVAEVVTVDGEPGIKLTYTGTQQTSVTIAEIPGNGLDDTRILYRAQVSSTDLNAPAYLELYAVVEGAAYFSRALHEELIGTMPVRPSSTPFFLEKGQALEAVRLGVRFEGPGSVTLSEMRLVEGAISGGASLGTWIGLAGALLGTLTALWFTLAQRLSTLGRARGLVLGVTLVVAVVGGAVLLIGVAQALGGAGYWSWYPLVLLGGIAAVVYGWNYPILRRRYAESEERRMLAMEI